MKKIYMIGGKGKFVSIQTILNLIAITLLSAVSLVAEEDGLLIVPPPDITITCDYSFPFNPNDPNAHIGEFDQRFGRIVSGPSRRNKIYVTDRVCPSHPRFSEYALASPSADPCYDDVYNILWGDDGYVDGTTAVPGFQNIVPFLHCNRGYLIREWRAWPNDPVVATQKITIIDCQEFYVPTVCWRFTVNDLGTCDLIAANDYKVKLIEWPCNIDLTRCQATGPGAFAPENLPGLIQDKRPRLASNRCNLLAATYNDVQFNFVDSSCAKVFRTWTVIDWCLYEDYIAGDYFGEYEWSFIQVIKLLNSENPTFAECEDLTFCGYGDPNNPQAGQCSGLVELRPTISDDCTPGTKIKIDYKIDLFDDGTIDKRGYSSNFDVNPFGTLPATQFPDTLANADGLYPVGTHKILWSAEDGCGNISACQYFFTIQDCKPPTPYCRDGISTIPMSTQAGGYVDIQAQDFNIGSTDNCTNSNDLIYSFSDDATDVSRRLTAADSGLVNLTVYVWDLDPNGLPLNYATCGVTVRVEPIGGQGNANRVAGRVEALSGFGIHDATVYLRYANGEVDSTQTDHGNYAFYGYDTTQTATIEVKKDTDHRNGVSTFDLVLIAKHIVGSNNLNSPYQIIAGDVNLTNSLTTFDIIGLRKVILYINNNFPDNESWRFLPANYVFPNPDNPFANVIPTQSPLMKLDTAHLTTIDFIGVKIGDVNESVSGLRTSPESETRGTAMTLRVMDHFVKAGEEFEMSFTAGQLMEIAGYQFGLKFDPARIRPLALANSDLLGLNDSNFGWDLVDKGLLTVSWHQTKTIYKSTDEALFSLRFKAQAAGRLSDLLSFGEELTAEYYQGDLQIRDLQLEFVKAPEKVFKVYPAQPNPYRETTTIGFDLPSADEVILSIYDVNGRLVKRYQQPGEKGFNQILVRKDDLATSGVLYFELQTSTAKEIGKMMLLN